MPTKQSHPITDKDLDQWVNKAEKKLKQIKDDQGLEEIFKELCVEEKWRTIPEDLALGRAVRNATCLYYYFVNLLMDRTELRSDAAQAGGKTNPTIEKKKAFISAYALFVMASSIVGRCNKLLRGKDQASLAHLNNLEKVEIVVGRNWENDLGYTLSYYVDAITSRNNEGVRLVQSPADLVSVSKQYWEAVAKKVVEEAKKHPDLCAPLEHVTFTHNKFVITGLSTTDQIDLKVISWQRVELNEVVGDPDVNLTLVRLCDRLALYDPTVGKNPFCEFGGLIESILLDGPPGTGKTTRMRLMMTQLERRAQQVGLPYVFKSITADQVKSEWYGRTAQLIAQLLEVVKDPLSLSLLFVDDIDLLLTGDRSAAGNNGADLDIMKALMDFFSGTGTNYTGNYIAVAATNKPTATDPALRQRFVYPAMILGPKSMEDYADLAYQELKGFAKTGKLQLGMSTKYHPLSRRPITKLEEIYDPALLAKYKHKKNGSWEDIGDLCVQLNRKDPKFTGRSVKNGVKVAIARAADFEVPKEWFENPNLFRIKNWEEKIELVRDLYDILTADKIMIALEYQFESEQRYQREAFQKRVEDVAESFAIQEAALKPRL